MNKNALNKSNCKDFDVITKTIVFLKVHYLKKY